MNSYKELKNIETNTAFISLCTDKIVRVIYKRKIDVLPEDLVINFRAYNQIVEGVKYPFILSAEDGTVNYTPEARKYAKAHEHDFPKICMALCGTHLSLKLIANFYLRFEKTFYPTKLFTKMEEAESWCKDQCILQEAH